MEKTKFKKVVLAFVPMQESDYRLQDAWLWFKRKVKELNYSPEEALENLKILQSLDSAFSKRQKFKNYYIKKLGTIGKLNYYLLLKKKRKPNLLGKLAELKEEVEKLPIIEAVKRLDKLLKLKRQKVFFAEVGEKVPCHTSEDWEVKFLTEKLVYHFGKFFFMNNYFFVVPSQPALKLGEAFKFEEVVCKENEIWLKFKRLSSKGGNNA
ncbi:MAG: hypothetical protein GXO57_09090 [Thermodesulfobacteria bacterium]|nr:hypothetical protein [Thermodesulfobacteriota bacterium]